MKIRIIEENEINFTPAEITRHINDQLNDAECYYMSEEKKMGTRFINSIHDGMRALWLRGEKIKAIKLMRTIFPVGLKEAKDYLESMYDEK